ncbi:MAG: hypothetical protein KKE91_02205 [Candidatus Omnitrophica bacterium]|nr:hypothetical protein [Candidatus Omnitrophota bacterium]
MNRKQIFKFIGLIFLLLTCALIQIGFTETGAEKKSTLYKAVTLKPSFPEEQKSPAPKTYKSHTPKTSKEYTSSSAKSKSYKDSTPKPRSSATYKSSTSKTPKGYIPATHKSAGESLQSQDNKITSVLTQEIDRQTTKIEQSGNKGYLLKRIINKK